MALRQGEAKESVDRKDHGPCTVVVEEGRRDHGPCMVVVLDRKDHG